MRLTSLIGILCLFAAAIQAQPSDDEVVVTAGDTTVRIRLPQGGLPNYFSGTSNEIQATAEGFIFSIKRFKVFVGGSLIVDRSYGENQLFSVLSTIRFDSTHFNNGSDLSVRVEATNWGNQADAIATLIKPVKNSFHAFARSDLERTGKQVTYIFDGDPRYHEPSAAAALNWKTLNDVDPPLRFTMNYAARDVSFAEGWDIDDWAGGLKLPNGNLPTPTVVFLSTHGNHSSEFGGYVATDKNDYWKYYTAIPQIPPDEADLEVITGETAGPPFYSVKAIREFANGTGIPPRNSTSQPPINLVAIWACHPGESNVLTKGFLFPTSYGAAPLKNQAGVAWAVNLPLVKYRATAKAFFQKLKLGWDVDEARDDAIFAAGPLAQVPGAVPAGEDVKVLRVYGDFATRLKGVYTGSAGQESDWKRVLN